MAQARKAHRTGLGHRPKRPGGKAFRRNLLVVAMYPESPTSLAMKEITKLLSLKIPKADFRQRIERGLERIARTK